MGLGASSEEEESPEVRRRKYLEELMKREAEADKFRDRYMRVKPEDALAARAKRRKQKEVIIRNVDPFIRGSDDLKKLTDLHLDCMTKLNSLVDEIQIKGKQSFDERINKVQKFMKSKTSPTKVFNGEDLEQQIMDALHRIGMHCSYERVVDAGQALCKYCQATLLDNDIYTNVKTFVREVISLLYRYAELTCERRYYWSEQDMKALVSFQRVCLGWLVKIVTENIYTYPTLNEINSQAINCINKSVLMLFHVIEYAAVAY